MTDAHDTKLKRNRHVRVYSRQTGMVLDDIVQLLRMEHDPVTVMRPVMIHAVKDEIDPWPTSDIDPVEEIKLPQSRVASGDCTREQACVSLGVDPEEVDREREGPTGAAWRSSGFSARAAAP